jgi:hypothetical protein
MSIAPTTENPTNLRDRESDDLTTIKGIGPARQKWLRQSLDVRTFQDLAALSGDEIESQLKAEGRTVLRDEIEEWIAQAQDHVARHLRSDGVVESAIEAGVEGHSPAEESAWKPFASFVVEFQARRVASGAEEQRTAVHYVEADRTEVWPGVTGERLWQWMLDQVGEKLYSEPEESRAEKPGARDAGPLAGVQPISVSPATVTITQLGAFQPPQTEAPNAVGRAGQPFQGYVRGGASFALKASFELVEPDAAEARNEHRTYRAQFYAHNPATGTTTFMGTTEPKTLVKGQSSYSAVLPAVSLPPGIYRLRVMVTLQGTPRALGFLEVPLLQVT